MSIKLYALAAVFVGASSTFAVADTYFSLNNTLDRTSTLDLGLIRSDGAGVIEIYEETGGELGALLGTQEIRSGVNSDVKVNVGAVPLGDVIAVIRIDGEIEASQKYDVN